MKIETSQITFSPNKISNTVPGVKENLSSKLIDRLVGFADSEYQQLEQFKVKSSAHSSIDKLLTLQRLFNEYSTKINLASKVIEAASSCIRKFQQQ